MKSIVLLLMSFILSSTALALELGEMITAGAGCFGSGKVIEISGAPGRYALPIRVRINKASETAFDRKSCQIRIPVTLNPNEKLQIKDLSQVIRVISQSPVLVKSNLMMGFVGRAGKPLTADIQTTTEENAYIENLRSEGIVAESSCGQSTMLTGNMNIIVQGQGAQAFASTGAALLSLQVVSCQ